MNQHRKMTDQIDQVKLLLVEIETCTAHLSKLTDALVTIRAMLRDDPRRRGENLAKLQQQTALTAHQIGRLVSHVEENMDLPDVLYRWLLEDGKEGAMYNPRDHMLVAGVFERHSGKLFTAVDIICELEQAGTPLTDTNPAAVDKICQSMAAELLVHACYRSAT